MITNSKKIQLNRKFWVENLRSGEYKQARQSLHNYSGEFCCLGVACDLFGKGKWDPSAVYYYEENEMHFGGSDIPASVRIALGLNNHVVRHLAILNDKGHSFSEIADYIENELELE
jgi:hypothetical protein